jgi:hypothetical protein
MYCSRHIFSDFSEHQSTESGVQEFSLKTVTLQNLEQLSELVNFLEVFKVSGGRVFVQYRKGFRKLFKFHSGRQQRRRRHC